MCRQAKSSRRAAFSPDVCSSSTPARVESFATTKSRRDWPLGLRTANGLTCIRRRFRTFPLVLSEATPSPYVIANRRMVTPTKSSSCWLLRWPRPRKKRLVPWEPIHPLRCFPAGLGCCSITSSNSSLRSRTRPSMPCAKRSSPQRCRGSDRKATYSSAHLRRASRLLSNIPFSKTVNWPRSQR